MAAFQGAAYFAIFFSSTPLKNKARLVSTEHSYSNCKKLCLNEAVGKTNCENTARTAVAFPLAIKKIFAIRRVLKKKSPEEMPYLKIKHFAATEAGTPGGGPAAPSTRKELWEILKIGKRMLR